VAEATFPHSDNSNTQSNPDWSVGYGYQFWRCRHDAYRGDGAFGQFCVVLPAQDAVLAINSGVRDMQAVLDKVWEHLLPVMEPQALAPDPVAYGALREKLGSLSLPAAAGNLPSPQAQAAARRRYTLQDNELNLQGIAFELEEHGSTLVIVDERGEHRVPVGSGSWRRGRSDLRGRGEEPVAACGAWPAQDTYEVRVCLYESELCFVLRLHLAGEELTLAYEPNVAWVEPKVTTIAGHAAVHVV
jgi:hypothetical protein